MTGHEPLLSQNNDIEGPWENVDGNAPDLWAGCENSYIYALLKRVKRPSLR